MPKSTSGSTTINGTRSSDTFEFSRDFVGQVLLNGQEKSYPSGDIPTLSGDRGDNRFVVHANPGGASYDGGGGADTLDFSHYSTDIGVSLLESGPRSGSVQYIYLDPKITYIDGYSTGYWFDLEMSALLKNVLNMENAIGGRGNDFLRGNSAANIIKGGGGNDHIDGHGGSDLVVGGDGNDMMLGAGGDDTIWGDNEDGTGSGADHFVIAGHSYSNDVIMDYRLADGDILSFTYTSRWSFIPTDWTYDAARGGMFGTFADGSSSVLLKGITSMDQVKVLIEGSENSDTIPGTALGETIIGNLGADVLSGGEGTDIFKFGLAHSNPDAPDTIKDFTVGEKIDLTRIDGDPATPGHQPLGYSETGPAPYSVWCEQTQPGSATLYLDANGDLTPDFVLLVQGSFTTLGLFPVSTYGPDLRL